MEGLTARTNLGLALPSRVEPTTAIDDVWPGV